MYKIEIRDINGNRSCHWFDSREEFYDFALQMSKQENADEYEILLIKDCDAVLFTALTDYPIDWENLVGYLV